MGIVGNIRKKRAKALCISLDRARRDRQKEEKLIIQKAIISSGNRSAINSRVMLTLKWMPPSWRP